MEVAAAIKSTQLSVPSPDGQHIATLNGTRLEIRRISTLSVIRLIETTARKISTSRFICLKWSPVTKGISDRILLAEEDSIRVWDLYDERWSATIDNGSAGMGKIANADFGADYTEILAWSAFGSRLTVWDLWTGKNVELKDPKFSTKGYGKRSTGRASIFALLTRPGAQDVLTLHAPGTYQVMRAINLPTVDAQGLKWSPDGRWIAVWDTPSMGYKVLLYTADGNLFRTYSGDYFDDELRGLGVKAIEWSPNGDFLVVTGYESSITLLTTKTFTPAIHLSHSATIQLSNGTVWQEMAAASSRTYEAATGPVQAPPASGSTSADLASKIGVSVMGFSADGSFLATKDDSIPTAAWIWDLSSLTCRAVMLQHSVIKKLAWHPTDDELLLVQCIQGEALLYQWRASDGEPRVLNMAEEMRLNGKSDASWVRTRSGRRPVLLLGDSNSFVLSHPDGRNSTPSPEFRAHGSNAASDSEDSLYDILTGDGGQAKSFQQTNMVEDTFQFRHKGASVGAY